MGHFVESRAGYGFVFYGTKDLSCETLDMFRNYVSSSIEQVCTVTYNGVPFDLYYKCDLKEDAEIVCCFLNKYGGDFKIEKFAYIQGDLDFDYFDDYIVLPKNAEKLLDEFIDNAESEGSDASAVSSES